MASNANDFAENIKRTGKQIVRERARMRGSERKKNPDQVADELKPLADSFGLTGTEASLTAVRGYMEGHMIIGERMRFYIPPK